MTLEAFRVDPRMDSEHLAVVLTEDDLDDFSLLAYLQCDSTVQVLDQRESQRAELRKLRPALTEAELAEPDRWIWYPWRRTLVGAVGPVAYRRLRLDRNRNKITQDEQDVLGQLRIGVVGLSVGHAIAHTLALEGICGSLRLADFDFIELSNLNRIPASLLDLGVNKAVVVARRIAELDPYLPTEVFPEGLTEESMDSFFDGLDLIVEECDSLDVKIRIRQEAKKRGIPVLMETSDRGLFDVERFDLEPDRDVFHGLLGDVDPASLRGLPTRDKAPHVLRILEGTRLSARMAASMTEIDQTVATWPQLGGDVQLGGATVAAAVRRFGRGESLPSGRIRVDLDHRLDELGVPVAAAAEPALDAPATDLTNDVPTDPNESIVHAIRLAPSGGNTQPWSIRPAADGVDIDLVRDRTSAMDVRFRGSYLAIGAGAFNARVAAAQHGLTATVSAVPHGTAVDTAVSLTLTDGAEPGLAELYPHVLRRVSNRTVGSRRPLSSVLVSELHAAAAAEGAALHLVPSGPRLDAVAQVLAESDRIRYLTPMLHEQMMSELKWPGRDRTDVGIDVRTLELDESDRAKLVVAGRSDVMALLAGWEVGVALGETTLERVSASSALAVITVAGDSAEDYVRAGMAVERFWVQAQRRGLGVQPVSPVFLYARDAADRRDLSPRYQDELALLQERFAAAVGLGASEVPALVMRISQDVADPSARSERLDRDAVVRGGSPAAFSPSTSDHFLSTSDDLMGGTTR